MRTRNTGGGWWGFETCFTITLCPGLEREEPNLTYEQCTRATGFTLAGLITASKLKGKKSFLYTSVEFEFHLKMKCVKNIFQAGLRIRICISLSCWIRIRIQKGKNDPQKKKKVKKITCSLLRAEGFSCSLGVLYRGLRINKLQFFIRIRN